MGGFVYVRKRAGVEWPAGAPAVETSEYSLYLQPKRFARAEQLVRFAGGDFIAATGTLLYRGRAGEAALRALHEDFGVRRVFDELLGSFAVILRKHGVVSCFNDYFGNYHLFSDARMHVVSSSFLAVAATLRKLEPSAQALYEYVFDGAIYGDETLVRGVQRLDPARIHRLHPVAEPAPAKPRPSAELPRGFDAQVDAANAALVSYFETLRRVFGDAVVLGLSGGYDSRLLLAAARKVGMRPRLFVGGAPQSADVRIALTIAAGCGLEIAHYDSAALEPPAPGHFAEIVREKHAYYDAVGIRGAVNDGEEYGWRLRRLAGASLELNGGGGEVYRDFWKLPDRPIAVRDFVRKTMEFRNRDKMAAATPRFDRRAYRERLAEKVRAALGGTPRASRTQVASLYTVLRSTAFAGPSNKELNRLGHGLLPFAEPPLAIPSFRIPLAYKTHGRFQSEMIRRLDPMLAAYPTSYGHRVSEPMPLAKRARETLERHCRDYLPLGLIFTLHRRLRKKNQYNSSPYCYAGPYAQALFGGRELALAEYFDLRALASLDDVHAFSRALTVELLLQGGVPASVPAALPRAA